MHTVLVADDNISWLETLVDGMNADPDFTVVGSATNGITALELIQQFLPDIIVLDIIMPECDGVHIVNHIRQNMSDYHPIIYMLSGIASDTVLTILNELDIDFYSMKPISLNITLENLKHILTYKNKSAYTNLLPKETLSREKIIRETLIELGLPPHLMCTKYIIQALEYYQQNPDSFTMLTKILYPYIAQCNNNTPGAVEKNIRSGIQYMQKEKTPRYQEIFQFYTNKRITNSVFLTVMSTYIHHIFEKNEMLQRKKL